MWLLGIFLTEFSPNPVSPQMEWVEIYNDSNNSVDLSGYSIRDSTATNKQILSGNVLPQTYFAFTFDNNFINNTTSDIVRLFDKNGNLVDSQSSKSIADGISFSRQTDGTWCPTDATPNLPNNLCKDQYLLSNSPTPVQYISLQITNLDPDSETIEITNPNNFSVNLFDWRVRDNSGSIRKLSCTIVNANDKCNATFTSGYLNNDQDKLTLFDPLKREISVYSYESQKQISIKPTSIPKTTIFTKKSLSPLSRGDILVPTKTEGFRSNKSTIEINKSSSIHNYLSIILMFIGSVFILFPFIFHAKNKY